jgi:hypothetical protein
MIAYAYNPNTQQIELETSLGYIESPSSTGLIARPHLKKKKSREGVSLFKVHYKHLWNFHNEIPLCY